jgi:hypothetical protein
MKIRPKVQRVAFSDSITESQITAARNLADCIAQQEQDRLALEAVAQLPDRYRHALVGSPRDIARLRGCSRQQVYLDRQKALIRVRRKLRLSCD